MAVEDQLSAAEAKFFETGELSPELTAENPVTEQPPEQAPQQVADATPAQPRSAEVPGAAVPPASVQPEALTALQRQLADAEQSRIALEQRLNMLLARLEAPPPAEPAPDPEADPFGHMQHQVNNMTKMLRDLQANLGKQTEQSQQSAQLNAFVERIRTMRDDFTKTTPDFADAYAHVRAMRAADLRDAGVPESQLPSAMLQDEIALSQAAINGGRNPAAVLYDMAKRHGYTPKAAPAAPANRIAQLQAGAAAAKTVPRAGADLGLSPDNLKEASEADLDKLVQSDDMWHKVMGGGRTNDIF